MRQRDESSHGTRIASYRERNIILKASAGLIVLVLAFTACARTGRALRDMPADRGYEITVQQVNDPRLPALSENEFRTMLAYLTGYIRDYLGYRVTFTVAPARGLASLQKEMAFTAQTREMKELKESLLDPGSRGDMKRLEDYIRDLVRKTDERTLIAYVPGYRAGGDREKLASALFERYERNLKTIHAIRTKDGSALSGAGYEETLTYPFWEMALRNLKNAHFIFPNTVMADAEVDIPIYVVLRYGITTGMVTENRVNAYGAAGVIFTYPFLARDPFFSKERGEAIPNEALLKLIALYTAHEFGHFLNHYKDYYDHPNCIMVPANDLNYLRWYRERLEKKCALPHEKLERF